MDRQFFLVLPNSIHEEYKNRSYQIASELSAKHRVYFIKLYDNEKKFNYLFNNSFEELLNKNIITLEKDSRLNIIKIPNSEKEQNYSEKRKIFSNLIENICKTYNIDIILNSSYDNFAVPEKILSEIFYIYDICEDYLEIEEYKDKLEISNFIETELYKAHLKLTASKELEKNYKRKYWVNLIYFPNGATYIEYSDKKKQLIKNKLFDYYKLKNKETKIISVLNLPIYWRNLEVLIKAFKKIKQQHKIPLTLLISAKTYFSKQYKNSSDIIFINNLKGEDLIDHFIFSDIGALPLLKCKYTDSSLPIPIIQYGMFKKTVITTPTLELQHHNLPYLIFSNNNIDNWSTSILWGLQTSWKPNWNQSIKKYSWEKLVLLLERLITRNKK